MRWGPDALRDTGTGMTAVRNGDAPGSVWLRLAGLVAVIALIVVGVLIVFGLGSSRDAGETPSEDPSGSTGSTTGDVVKVAGVRDLDPPSQGGNGEEHPEEARLAIDGDEATAWETQDYNDGQPMAPYKQGVGLVLDLGSETSVSSLTVTLGGSGYAFDVYAAPEGSRSPSDITGLDRVAREQGAGGEVQVDLDDPVTTRYVVVWLTSLAADGGGFRGQVQEIVVRS
jgi:hypothetical protein